MTDQRLEDGVGCWFERLTDHIPLGRPALFLDRDGVIVEETNYLCDPADVRLIDGAADAIAFCNLRDIPVVVVTNQAGIARGYYGWSDFEAVQREILDQLGALGARVDLVLACAYHNVGHAPYLIGNHHWRKPNPGMICAAAKILQTDVSRSVIAGDKISDIEAGAAAGVTHRLLMLTGHGEQERRDFLRARSTDVDFTVETNLAHGVHCLFATAN